MNEAFGDRHHRPDPDSKLSDTAARGSARVRLVVDDQVAATKVGQLGAWLAVNLLARLDGLVTQIELVSPPVKPDAALVQLRALMDLSGQMPATLLDELTELCQRVSGGRASVVNHASRAGQDERVAFELVLGTRTVSESRADRTVWCCGRRWLTYVGNRPESLPSLAGERNPLGMYMAVCYGVGEVFKFLRGLKPEIQGLPDTLYVSLWSGMHADSWSELQDGPEVDGVQLEAGYVAGAGAVGQAVLFAVATSTGGPEHTTIVDSQTIDRKNRNRYMLAFREHEDAQKAEHAATFMRAHGMPAHGEPLHWLPYTRRLKLHQKPEIAKSESELRYGLVLSCVDTNPARNDLQSFWPRDIIGGSTHGLRAQVAHYNLRTGTACLACHNQVRSFEALADELRQELNELGPSEKRARLRALEIPDQDIDAVIEYLKRPDCGQLGEAALQNFAETGPPSFSVGFVSVAAGLLVARTWIRYSIGGPGDATEPDRHYLTMNFFNGRFRWSEQGIRQGCVCQTQGRAVWQRLWEGR